MSLCDASFRSVAFVLHRRNRGDSVCWPIDPALVVHALAAR
jgi:hypothetical protein